MSGEGAGGERIWVTGLGAITALGGDLEATWTRLLAGERGLSNADLFDTTGQRATLVAQVRAPVPEPAGDVAWSRTALLALAAAREALAWAKLDPGAARVGVIVGGTTGGKIGRAHV